METKVRIQDDLYEAVNGEWLSTAVIPDDRPTTGGFSTLAQDVEKTMMDDFRQFSAGEKKCDITGFEDAVRLYRKVLDTERRNADGIKPVLPVLHLIDSITSVEQLNEKALDLIMAGANLPFNCSVEADMADATRHAFIITGPDIILPDTTYYQLPQGQQLLDVYGAMASQVLSFTDLSEEKQKQYLEDTFKFDRLVAQKVKSQVEWAEYVNNHNPMALSEVEKNVAPIDLRGILTKIYGENVPEIIDVYDPKAIKEMSFYFNEENLPVYLHWCYVQTLLGATSLLSEELASLGRLYRRTLMGVAQDPVIEKQAYQVASSLYSEPVGIYYGRTYFGEEAKKDVISIVRKIIDTYKSRMKKNSFLKEETKEKAILKLSTIAIKMGYPDEPREIYKKMTLSDEESYYDAVTRIRKIRTCDALEKLHKPVDRSDWAMPGHLVNACYDPSRNDITFPAAILQKPFYSIHQSVSENLGGIGTVIAHEISHAFDNSGAHFDENGNLADWWSPEDFEAFDKLTKDMVKQWDGIEYCGGKVNGELVVSENIADNGGVAVALEVMHHTEGADFREFFMNFARIWCMKAKTEYIQLLLANDVHSPAKLRANIQVRNFPEWYQAFDVTEKDQMYIAPEKRIIIW